MENILTFRSVQDAINHCLDSNLVHIDLVQLENDLTARWVHYAKYYKVYFIIDPKH